MEEINFFDDLGIYEVDRYDYDAYFHRLPQNDIMKITPREGFVAYKDIITGQIICGILSETVMAMPANRYFIFNFLDEERLGEHKTYQHIHMTEEEYVEFLQKLQAYAEGNKKNA